VIGRHRRSFRDLRKHQSTSVIVSPIPSIGAIRTGVCHGAQIVSLSATSAQQARN